MFRPTAVIQIENQSGFDEYGRISFATPFDAPCNVMLLRLTKVETERTTLHSASESNAFERQAQSIFLVDPSATVSVDDRITYKHFRMKVDSVEVRRKTSGVVDHTQIWCSICP